MQRGGGAGAGVSDGKAEDDGADAAPKRGHRAAGATLPSPDQVRAALASDPVRPPLPGLDWAHPTRAGAAVLKAVNASAARQAASPMSNVVRAGKPVKLLDRGDVQVRFPFDAYVQYFKTDVRALALCGIPHVKTVIWDVSGEAVGERGALFHPHLWASFDYGKRLLMQDLEDKQARDAALEASQREVQDAMARYKPDAEVMGLGPPLSEIAIDPRLPTEFGVPGARAPLAAPLSTAFDIGECRFYDEDLVDFFANPDVIDARYVDNDAVPPVYTPVTRGPSGEMADQAAFHPALPTLRARPTGHAAEPVDARRLDLDVLRMVLKWVDPISINNFAQTCKTFYLLATGDELWWALINRDWGSRAVCPDHAPTFGTTGSKRERAGAGARPPLRERETSSFRLFGTERAAKTALSKSLRAMYFRLVHYQPAANRCAKCAALASHSVENRPPRRVFRDLATERQYLVATRFFVRLISATLAPQRVRTPRLLADMLKTRRLAADASVGYFYSSDEESHGVEAYASGGDKARSETFDSGDDASPPSAPPPPPPPPAVSPAFSQRVLAIVCVESRTVAMNVTAAVRFLFPNYEVAVVTSGKMVWLYTVPHYSVDIPPPEAWLRICAPSYFPARLRGGVVLRDAE